MLTANPGINSANKKFHKELNGGTVSLVLLAVLDRSENPLYGYEITKRIGAEDVGMMKQGALYPVLRSLERNRLLTSQVEPSQSGPPRRYYRITDEGRATLADWTRIWRHARDFVDAVLEGTPNVP
jgi:PadR family transcriptional regulator PadR